MGEEPMVGGNATQATQLSDRAKKESPIGNASGQLQKSHAVLNDELMMLADMLKPVMTPVDSADKQGSEPNPPRSDVADMLAREAERAFSMASFVRSIRERVEL